MKKTGYKPSDEKETNLRNSIQKKTKERGKRLRNEKGGKYKQKMDKYNEKMNRYKKNQKENDRKRKEHDELYDERINNLNEAYVALLRKSKNPESPAQKGEIIKGFA